MTRRLILLYLLSSIGVAAVNYADDHDAEDTTAVDHERKHNQNQTPQQRSRPLLSSKRWPIPEHGDETPGASQQFFSIQDLDCYFYEQPLNHFYLPRNQSGTFRQRYCISNQFVVAADNAATPQEQQQQQQSQQRPPPIFFYTGNESPLEQYIEQTGLLWELAQAFGAQVVFAEHRYEGQSIPQPAKPPCMAYSSSVQALADYARLIRNVLWRQAQWPWRCDNDDGQDDDKYEDDTVMEIRPRPVICFGGSYGGMLSAWMRMKYPQWVAGSIAASAPIWGFPIQNNNKNKGNVRPELRMDGAAAVIRHGLFQSFPPNATDAASTNEKTTSEENKTEASSTYNNHCPNNLLASFVLIHILGREQELVDRKNQLYSSSLKYNYVEFATPPKKTTSKDVIDFLTQVFHLCPTNWDSSRNNKDSIIAAKQASHWIASLLEWLQRPWFDLAEGSFPYPSSYIPFALTHLNVTLPAWPLQTACWKTGLVQDYGIKFQGSLPLVKYNITFSSSNHNSDNHKNNVTISVDWDNAHSSTPVSDWLSHPAVKPLLSSVREAVAIWYNVTHNVTCFDMAQAAPNLAASHHASPSSSSEQQQQDLIQTNGNDIRTHASHRLHAQIQQQIQEERTSSRLISEKRDNQLRIVSRASGIMTASSSSDDDKEESHIRTSDTCQERLQTGSWPSLCCNEDMNLIITLAQGSGRDVFWPPNIPSSVQSYSDYVEYYGDLFQDPFCQDPDGIFGYPSKTDPWSNWLDLQYGNYRVLESSSNIVFSNGLLDPWSAAGVIDWESLHNSTTAATNKKTSTHRIMPGLTLQKFKQNKGMASLLLDYGGHHVDLMYSNARYDPPSFTIARKIETWYIKSWIVDFWNMTST